MICYSLKYISIYNSIKLHTYKNICVRKKIKTSLKHKRGTFQVISLKKYAENLHLSRKTIDWVII